MKKYILLIIMCLGIVTISNAQNTEGVKKSVIKKKNKAKRVKTGPIVINKPSDNQFLGKLIDVEPDTVLFKLNMIDSTVLNFKGNSTVVRWQKVCSECFSIRDMQRDTLTSDSIATRIKRITVQYDQYEYTLPNFIKYKKLAIDADPQIKKITKEIADKQKQLELIKAEVKANKN